MTDYKKLDKMNVVKLQTLEKELGCCLVALEPKPKLAKISAEQLRKLQSVEKELDAVILAYNC